MTAHFYKIILPQWCLSAIALFILVFHFQWIFILYILLGFYIIGIFGNTIGFHRYLTHQSFTVNTWWHYIFVFLGSMTGQGSIIFWAALHLHHHRNSDNADDIHSPKRGFFNSTILWQIKGKFDNMPGLIAPRKLYKDPVIRFIHHNYYIIYWTIGITLAIIDIYIFLFFFTFGAFFLMSIVDNLGNFIMHHPAVGYTNFSTKDSSRNVPIISYITLGGGWHNNHHYAPKNSKFGVKDNEPDLSSSLIDIIKRN